MIDSAFAQQFAADWIAAWNSHDLERILAHYEDDFEMSSPKIVPLVGEQSGTLRGRAAIGAYWAKGLQLNPALHFDLITVLAGTDSVTLHYKGAGGRLAAEVFFFSPTGKVARAFAHYEI